MSTEYDLYLKKHINGVKMAVNWFFSNIDSDTLYDIFPNLSQATVKRNAINHDLSKYSYNEYTAYDRYFYGGGRDTEEGREEFGMAFLNHVHQNPHHWQNWVLIDDDASDSLNGTQVRPFDMDDDYILEMIADWWSFSLNGFLDRCSDPKQDSNDFSDLYGIFDWYDKNKESIIFSPTTRNKVESFLNVLRETIDSKVKKWPEPRYWISNDPYMYL